MVGAVVSLGPVVNLLLLLVVILAVIVAHMLILFLLLLFGVLHLLHGAAVFCLLVDRLHVVPRREHLVPAHATRTRPHRSLLTLTFAFFATALVKGRVQLKHFKKMRVKIRAIFESVGGYLRRQYHF